jgi:hypothetical protein
MICMKLGHDRNDLQSQVGESSGTEETDSLGSAGSGTGELGDGGCGRGLGAVARGGGITADAAGGSDADGGVGSNGGSVLDSGIENGGVGSDGGSGSGSGLHYGRGLARRRARTWLCRNLDGDTSSLAGLLDGGDGGSLVLSRASLLDAGDDGSEEGLGLLAVAVEVIKSLAAIAGERSEEAVELYWKLAIGLI